MPKPQLTAPAAAPRLTANRARLATATVLLSLAAGCASPLHPDTEPELRHSILNSIRHDTQGSLAPAADGKVHPAIEPTAPRVQSLGLSPDILTKLEQNSGPSSYASFVVPLGPTLTGEPQKVATISLKRAILTTASNNLTLQFARLVPSIKQTDTERAQAAFDWTLFASTQLQTQDNQSRAPASAPARSPTSRTRPTPPSASGASSRPAACSRSRTRSAGSPTTRPGCSPTPTRRSSPPSPSSSISRYSATSVQTPTSPTCAKPSTPSATACSSSRRHCCSRSPTPKPPTGRSSAQRAS
ncbi:MAG: hypothetical protein QM783_08365 [Phycisphaerales bacterium]